jgi:hypothetical protein
LQTKPARRAQNFFGQFAFQAVGIAGCSFGCRPHETLLLRPRQFWSVLLIFPQESAVVTNTCSKRKDGLLYGFFGARAEGE